MFAFPMQLCYCDQSLKFNWFKLVNLDKILVVETRISHKNIPLPMSQAAKVSP